MSRYKLEESNYGDFKRIRMNCDVKFNDKLKPPFPDSGFSMAIVGKAGCGKSSLLNQMFGRGGPDTTVYHRVFSDITYVIPESSAMSVENSPLAGIPTMPEFNLDVVDKIQENYERYEKAKGKMRHQLLILDDVAAQLKGPYTNDLQALFFNRRHLNLSIIVISQYVYLIPKSIRSQLSIVFLFKIAVQDRTNIFNEFIDLSKDDYTKLLRFVYGSGEKNYNFLAIDVDANVYFKNLQKIIV